MEDKGLHPGLWGPNSCEGPAPSPGVSWTTSSPSRGAWQCSCSSHQGGSVQRDPWPKGVPIPLQRIPAQQVPLPEGPILSTPQGVPSQDLPSKGGISSLIQRIPSQGKKPSYPYPKAWDHPKVGIPRVGFHPVHTPRDPIPGDRPIHRPQGIPFPRPQPGSGCCAGGTHLQ